MVETWQSKMTSTAIKKCLRDGSQMKKKSKKFSPTTKCGTLWVQNMEKMGNKRIYDLPNS